MQLNVFDYISYKKDIGIWGDKFIGKIQIILDEKKNLSYKVFGSVIKFGK